MAIGISFVLTYMYNGDLERTFCETNTEHKTQEDGGSCTFQAISLVYFGLAGEHFGRVG